MTRPGPTPKRPYRAARASRRPRAALVGLLLVLAGIVVGAVPAAAQNAVGASTPNVANTVGVSTDISAGQRLGRTSPQPQIVVATAVAAETGPGLLPRLRGRIGDLADDTGGIGRGNPLTNSQAAQMADRLGYSPAGRLRVKNQQVFRNGNDFIVQDIDSHLPAGLWKRGGSYEDLFSKRTRMGTYDYDLNWIGP